MQVHPTNECTNINPSGLDLDCGIFFANHTLKAIQTGLVKEAEIDRALTQNFVVLMRLGFFDGDPRKQKYGSLGPKDVCAPAHQELAREAARQGIVLLKNKDESLPLLAKSIKSVAVIGPQANVTHDMIGNYEGKLTFWESISFLFSNKRCQQNKKNNFFHIYKFYFQ